MENLSDSRITEVKKELARHFDMKDMGELKHFLGMKIIQHPNGNIWMGQTSYTKNVLEKFGMETTKQGRGQGGPRPPLVREWPPCRPPQPHGTAKKYKIQKTHLNRNGIKLK